MLANVIKLLIAELEENEIDYDSEDIRLLAGDLVSELHNNVLNADVITAACLAYSRCK